MIDCLASFGRNRRSLSAIVAVAVGFVAYLALAFAFHPVVIGVPVFGGLEPREHFAGTPAVLTL